MLRNLLLFILSVSVQHSWAGSSNCSDLIALEKVKTPKVVQRWMKEKAEYYKDITPKSVSVNGTVYTKLIPLGLGGEASVFLVKTNAGPIKIKVFKDEFRFRRGLKNYKRFERWLPKLLALDTSTFATVTEFIEGIDMYDVIGRGHLYGVSNEVEEQLEKRWWDWRAEINKELNSIWYHFFFKEKPFIQPRNTIYSFETDSFYLIDPI